MNLEKIQGHLDEAFWVWAWPVLNDLLALALVILLGCVGLWGEWIFRRVRRSQGHV